jgi:hypothetical protein
MPNYKEGTFMPIKSFKHNGVLHRVWDDNLILSRTDDAWITVNNQVTVTEADGTTWRTKEPAISFFSTALWFNVVAIMPPEGVYYYCNLASPVRWDAGALTYIDYDLDVMVEQDGTVRLLDEAEYESHKQLMHYPANVTDRIEKDLAKLYDWIEKGVGPFHPDFIQKWYDRYRQYVEMG